jgi:hypothetical protein
MRLTPAALRFGAASGGNAPAQTLQVENVGGGALGWTATATSAGNWLTVSPATGVAPSAVTVIAQTAGLPAGVHTAAITFSALPGVEATNIESRIIQ